MNVGITINTSSAEMYLFLSSNMVQNISKDSCYDRDTLNHDLDGVALTNLKAILQHLPKQFFAQLRLSN